MADIDLKNSHYLNEKNRIFPDYRDAEWTDRDADYNIRSGITFGETEEITIEKQGWDGRSKS